MKDIPLLSDRVKSLEPSMTLAITARAKYLAKEGRDICSLSAGEPDFQTPSYVIEAAKNALDAGITRYGPAAGDPELREAIAIKLSTENNIQTNKDNIIITNGGKQAIYNLFQVVLNYGDEVIIPSPYWLSYPTIVQLAGGIPVMINSDPKNGFKLNIKKLKESVTNKTRIIIINSPCNPTGQIISKEELLELADLVRRNPRLMIMSDEIYEYIIESDETHYSIASIAPDIKDRVFTVNGFSKGWAMTGWRIGYITGESTVIQKSIALQSQTTSNVCSFAQRGALAALNNSNAFLKQMNKKYNERRNLLFNTLIKIKGLSLIKPKGAFYAFPFIEKKSFDSLSFCKTLLEEEGLALVPGKVFGANNCVRISCSASKETIEEGLTRLTRFMNKIM